VSSSIAGQCSLFSTEKSILDCEHSVHFRGVFPTDNGYILIYNDGWRRDETILWIQNFKREYALYQTGSFQRTLEVDENWWLVQCIQKNLANKYIITR